MFHLFSLTASQHDDTFSDLCTKLKLYFPCLRLCCPVTRLDFAHVVHMNVCLQDRTYIYNNISNF